VQFTEFSKICLLNTLKHKIIIKSLFKGKLIFSFGRDVKRKTLALMAAVSFFAKEKPSTALGLTSKKNLAYSRFPASYSSTAIRETNPKNL
jgi:hypothetical protein